MFLRTWTVSISSSKQMSHCVPPFDVGNATVPIPLATPPVKQSSSDRLLRDPSLPLRERIKAATQNKTDNLRLRCKKYRFSCWLSQTGVVILE